MLSNPRHEREVERRKALFRWAAQPLPLEQHSSSRQGTNLRGTQTARSRPVGRPRPSGRLLPLWVGLFALLNFADLLSTFLGLHNGMREGNPLMSALLIRYGFGALILYKILVICAVAGGVYILRRFHSSIANVTIWICNLLVAAVVALNIAQYALMS
jgi:hypothetical protein